MLSLQLTVSRALTGTSELTNGYERQRHFKHQAITFQLCCRQLPNSPNKFDEFVRVLQRLRSITSWLLSTAQNRW